jgi:hypothetical protein
MVMNQKLIRGCSGVFSALMLMVLGCGPLATGEESTVATETAEAETEAQARSELAVAKPSAPEQAAAEQEMATHEGEAQALATGQASAVVMPGLTILNGALYGSTSDPYWTLDIGSGTRSWTAFVSFQDGAFSSPPAVSVSLSHFYMDANVSRSWINVTAENVTVSGFTLRFTTASTSLVYSAIASWLAYGPNANTLSPASVSPVPQ